jgi:hypothetical protein
MIVQADQPVQANSAYNGLRTGFWEMAGRCPWRVRQCVLGLSRSPTQPRTKNAPAASAESARGIWTRIWIEDVGQPIPS